MLFAHQDTKVAPTPSLMSVVLTKLLFLITIIASTLLLTYERQSLTSAILWRSFSNYNLEVHAHLKCEKN